MRTREEIEQLEVRNLAPYAMCSRDSAGRVYAESLDDKRTCYQRDRDRIVHLRAFRNLEYKTQVFPIFEGDYYRTRLTHTLEVAQIARTIGRNLMLNEDLIEAVALAHDLGHPPFGHAGEKALDEIMSEEKLEGFFSRITGKHKPKGFNHNKRSYEIVTRERRYPNFEGLNLTKEVLVGILKHKTVYDIPSSEEEFLKEFPTLEAQVVNVADELAYLDHDIDDGLASGYIKKEDLAESKLWTTTLDQVRKTTKSTNEIIERNQIVKNLINIQVVDLLQNSDKAIEERNFKSVLDVKTLGETVIKFSDEMDQERCKLQKLINEKLYHHYRVERMTMKAKRVVHRLFDIYSSNLNQLPYEIYDRHVQYGKQEEREVICNFISDMTDRAALSEYKKLI
ncbi:MAG: deoxyguanosinetriphosphate triphosphohydrolase [Candidatus Omnitrophica bacterium]|nr:deoxyguanosinetriphosphate triphosphohydrolase [Candidatus Omnitrophota bacterium]